MTINERIRQELTAQHKRQDELARYVGCSKSTVNYWVNKPDADIPGRFIMSICEYLDVSCRYLLTGEPDDPEPVNEPTESELTLTEEESALLSIFRELSLEGRTMTLATAYKYKSALAADLTL